MHLEEAVVTPSSAPGVLDEPVVDAIFSTVADSQDCMVDITRAVKAHLADVDARAVVSEAIHHFECHGDRPVRVDCLLQVCLIGGYVD